MWGRITPGDKQSEQCRKILDVTISLLSAIVAATSLKTSQRHANLYLQHLQAYLSGVTSLFPDYTFQPKHHMALHLPEYLLRYGPVHAWWAFPFERIIGMLQRIPVNGKIGTFILLFLIAYEVSPLPAGEYEETIAKSFTRSANLRGLLCKAECPQALQHCEPMFKKLVNPDIRSTLVNDILKFSLPDDDDEDIDHHPSDWDERAARPIPHDLRVLLCSVVDNVPRTARFLSHLNVGGVTYAVASHHAGNSHVLVRTDDAGPSVPARMDNILQVHTQDSVQTYIALRHYKHPQVEDDPFRHFPVLQTRMWSSRLGPVQVISPNAIDTHFAKAEVTWEGKDVIVAASLSRVSQVACYL
jgi:hypothetical protein